MGNHHKTGHCPVFYSMIDLKTFFVKAIVRGDTSAVDTMLEMGASVDTVILENGELRSVLWLAALYQHKDVCELLLARGASLTLHINDTGNEFPNLLYMVVWSTDLTLRLIDLGLDPKAQCPFGLNLSWWAAYAENTNLVQQLERLGL